ncbi:pseudouridine synthase [Corynebacterium yudongzhengii]|uniref:Pseudouridine synthase n=1 Tax=Corynebacterium yudongzhengii TaxID=2080740 RepID=A0A2U1T8K4_9CORY|nr:pseudouridine synthase [Corynebacterium yudongzhengii]AWB81949.1 pseudouridine synthase [Corynebacterium yudongzhengii]PWC02341.1 rRNA pseudouridine synthase [Corynebacterium yudongzhengii]
MTPPASRDGTPDKKQKSRKLPRVSNAKPARKQNIENPLADNWWDDAPAEGERLQKVMARAGVASRRHSEVMIEKGRVEVNGEVVRTQGRRVNPAVDIIRVDGVRINVNEDLEYFLFNKPRGMLCTMSDEQGRPCVGDVIADKVVSGQRLFHVGRLDADTEGLLLLTNDGELANRLTHPRYEVTKTYLATVLGEASNKLVNELKKGIELDDGLAKADYVQIIDKNQGYSLIRIELHEGRKHIVRRMLKAAGFPVQRLVRTKLHTVQLGDQKPGNMRALNSAELTALYKAVGM